jgi:prepilin-type N-terminal cleavage/methylation domain-containing protein
MLNLLRSKKGFTLIELLIVVAIIGILAAIAIPQFASYRQKGFNAAGLSDVRNIKTAEEGLFTDFQTYGVTENATLAGASGVGGAGNLLSGPMSSATAASTGGLVTGSKADGSKVAMSTALSNGVAAYASSNGGAVGVPATAYFSAGKHMNGTRVFSTETATTTIAYVQNDGWAGGQIALGATGTCTTPNAVAGLTSTVAVPYVQIITTTLAGGGLPTANWSNL